MYHPLIKHQKNRKRFLPILFIVLFLLILVFLGSYLQRGTYQISNVVTFPFFWVGGVIQNGGNSLSSFFTSKESLVAENERLRQDLQIKELELIGTRLIISENEALKELLERGGERSVITGSVLSKPDFSPYDTVIIDVGGKDGVSIGDKVIFGDMVIVGEVEAVYSSTSRVKFFSSPGERHAVLIGEGAIEAEAKGLGGGNFEVILPRTVGISEGDIIVLPEVSDKIFGVVERVGVGPSDTFQKILFKNPMNIFELRFIGILKDE